MHNCYHTSVTMPAVDIRVPLGAGLGVSDSLCCKSSLSTQRASNFGILDRNPNVGVAFIGFVGYGVA